MNSTFEFSYYFCIHQITEKPLFLCGNGFGNSTIKFLSENRGKGRLGNLYFSILCFLGCFSVTVGPSCIRNVGRGQEVIGLSYESFGNFQRSLKLLKF